MLGLRLGSSILTLNPFALLQVEVVSLNATDLITCYGNYTSKITCNELAGITRPGLSLCWCHSFMLCLLSLTHLPLCYVIIPVYNHTHTLIITLHYACCYYEIKGIQDFKLYVSHADSLCDSLSLCYALLLIL